MPLVCRWRMCNVILILVLQWKPFVTITGLLQINVFSDMVLLPQILYSKQFQLAFFCNWPKVFFCYCFSWTSEIRDRSSRFRVSSVWRAASVDVVCWLGFNERFFSCWGRMKAAKDFICCLCKQKALLEALIKSLSS